MKTTLDYGKRYRLLRVNGEVVEGECIQTKANDEDYPPFLLDDGSRLGTTRDHVLGPVDDSAPPGGIPRTFTTGVEGGLDGPEQFEFAIPRPEIVIWPNGDGTDQDPQ